jgi:hypothetical protein
MHVLQQQLSDGVIITRGLKPVEGGGMVQMTMDVLVPKGVNAQWAANVVQIASHGLLSERTMFDSMSSYGRSTPWDSIMEGKALYTVSVRAETKDDVAITVLFPALQISGVSVTLDPVQFIRRQGVHMVGICQ